MFAGRACTRGVALPSVKPEDISDYTADFNKEQHQNAADWLEFYREKYPFVARLRGDTLEEASARRQRHAARHRKEAEVKQSKARAKALESGGKVYSMLELARFDASDPTLPILMAVGGHVLDVSKSDYLYGPQKPRHCYAGRSITRALATGSVDEAELSRGDDLDGLTDANLAALKKRVLFLLGKFPKMGVLEHADIFFP